MGGPLSVSDRIERKAVMAVKHVLFIFCLILCLDSAAAQVSGETAPKVGIQEKLGQNIPLDAEVYDGQGRLVTLNDLVNKPTIFTFVYYRCPGICSPLLNELAKVVNKLDLVIGKEYQILTISFDHREKPELAAEKQQSYLDLVGKDIDQNGWRFFTADSATIQRLTDAAGFYFMRSGNDYVHAGALIVASPEGKITRYINGIQYLPFDVKMAVYEASTGTVTPTIAKILTMCYSYDPEAHTYTLNVLRLAMLLVVGLVGVFVLVFIVKPKKKQAER
jgi:protein SCO1/2